MRSRTLCAVSFDVFVWRGPMLTADEVAHRLQEIDEHGLDESSAFERSDRLVRFRKDVLRRYPALEDLDEDAPITPWAMTPVESTYFIELNLQWSAAEDAITWILQQAHACGLYIYDPQGFEVVRPGPARWQVLLRRLRLDRLAGPDP